MKQQVSEPVNGVQVENTLSMALQKPYPKRRKIWLILTAYTGVAGSIFSFMSMFAPVYSLPVLLLAMTAFFAFFAYFSLYPKKSLVPVLISVLIYCVLFFREKHLITSGLMYLTNNVCQAIYMTDWEYFVTDSIYSERASVTCVLCFLIFPIIWMICYSVLRYQNCFLSLLVTFPFLEIGLFFGIVPNHLFAGMLFAFWFAMASVQTASSGITQNGGKTGFLRKKNAFLPVSNMRYLLPEYTGIIMIFSVMLIFGASEFALYRTGYERPEAFKTMRTDFQNYIASLHLTDDPILENYGETPEQPDDETHIPLGSVEEKIYQNTPVTSIAFSENPETRIYLKYRTGHVYNGINWSPLPEEAYQNQNFEVFSQLDYYPPEFLYSTVTGGNPVQAVLYHSTGILSQCVPYGFKKNHQIICQPDDIIQTSTQNYTIRKQTDYEEILRIAENVHQKGILPLLDSAPEEDRDLLSLLMLGKTAKSVWMSENSRLVSDFYGTSYTASASEAGILCGSFYDDFVYENYTALPDSPSLQAVRTAYADLLSGFDARTASPAEIIIRLELLRDRVCDNVNYTLAPGKTPANTDHTAYFLLENQKGYCEHYATAGTVLARMAGIPARYCEGYMIDCSQSGTLTQMQTENGSTAWTSEILDSNAHAWTEIYLSGLGWIPFEFTFSYFTMHAPEITYVPEAEAPETAPPAPVPVTEPDVPEPTTAPAPVPELPEPAGIPANMLIIIIVLTVSAVLCFIALILRIVRLAVLRKRESQFAQEDRKQASFCVYRYLTDLLRECGVQTSGKTIGGLVEESEKLCAQYMDSVYSLSSAVQIGAKLRYSPHPMTNSELHYLMRTANTLADGMYQQAGIFKKFYYKWLRHYL